MHIYPKTNEAKDTYTRRVRAILYAVKAIEIVVCSESWISSNPNCAPSEDPSCIEAIVLVHETANKSMMHIAAIATRDGKRVLEPWTCDEMLETRGRMVGLLKGQLA